ncbi:MULTISPECIES: PadR family transcriptional regulator [unclassified Streptomyces]|uniref:PadR family transcriptional regulator n=1 Tax=unclassified Streptomyces TaxID=2593676 RepID=UPI00336A5BA5
MTVTAKRRKLSNPLALAVMALLSERPMHPYEIAQVLRQRGKDQSIKIKYGSLYTVVQNLEKHGFVEVAGVQRQGLRPERTVYGLTEEGRRELHDWLAELVSVPAQEYPAFAAALSLILVLPLDEADELLRQRVEALEARAEALDHEMDALTKDLPRVFLLEAEYQLHMIRAETEWIRSLRGELAEGGLSGADAWRTLSRTGEIPAEWVEIKERIKLKE